MVGVTMINHSSTTRYLILAFQQTVSEFFWFYLFRIVRHFSQELMIDNSFS